MLNFALRPVSLAELKFLFLFCPNNSGSTVLCQYIAEQTGGYLPPYGNNEGQMMPAVREMMRHRPWDESSAFDWPFIRKEWERAAGERLFIEGSPPNILRVDAIAETFGDDSTAILSISDPYQQIASSFRRYRRPGEAAELLVPQWLRKARRIREIAERYPQFPLIRYDDFTADPQTVNRLLGIPVIPTSVKGKQGSSGRGIENMRAVTVLFLTEPEIDRISELLAGDEDIVRHFGYAIRSGRELIRELSEDGAALERARSRRRSWERSAPA